MTPSIAPAVLAPAVQLNGPLLNLSIPEEEQNTYIWWAVMCAICAANVAFLFHSRRVSPPRDAHERSMELAATVFVLGCAWRGVFPVQWEIRPHGCLFETPMMLAGGELLDELVAQAVECAIAYQAAQTTARALRAADAPGLARVAARCHWPIVVLARTACWIGCATDNKAFHIVEESTWATCFGLLALCAWASFAFEATRASVATPKDSSPRDFLATVALAFSVYFVFMYRVDVPMYVAQWREDTAARTEYWSFADGLREMVKCDQVTRDFEHWREGVPWMTGYFAVVPYASVLLMRTKLPPGPVARDA